MSVPAPEKIRAFLDAKVCAACGSPLAPFGFRVRVRAGRFGIWACMKHREQVRAMREFADAGAARIGPPVARENGRGQGRLL